MIESVCGKCGEVYNPHNVKDSHWFREDESECGGLPTMIRRWDSMTITEWEEVGK